MGVFTKTIDWLSKELLCVAHISSGVTEESQSESPWTLEALSSGTSVLSMPKELGSSKLTATVLV